MKNTISYVIIIALSLGLTGNVMGQTKKGLGLSESEKQAKSAKTAKIITGVISGVTGAAALTMAGVAVMNKDINETTKTNLLIGAAGAGAVAIGTGVTAGVMAGKEKKAQTNVKNERNALLKATDELVMDDNDVIVEGLTKTAQASLTTFNTNCTTAGTAFTDAQTAFNSKDTSAFNAAVIKFNTAHLNAKAISGTLSTEVHAIQNSGARDTLTSSFNIKLATIESNKKQIDDMAKNMPAAPAAAAPAPAAAVDPQ